MKPTQHQIEQMAGIKTQDIADYIMSRETPAARNALVLLELQVRCYEHAGFGLLTAAVEECIKEMQRKCDE